MSKDHMDGMNRRGMLECMGWQALERFIRWRAGC